MLAIEDELIKGARRISFNEEVDSPNKGPNMIDHLLSSSPPNLPDLNELSNTNDSNTNLKRPTKPIKNKQEIDETKTRPSAPSFAKVPVVKNVKLSSSLSKGLESSRLHAALTSNPFHTTSRGGSLHKIDVYFAIEQTPMKMKVEATSTVEEVIDFILKQYAEEKRSPALAPDSDVYDLRMVDEDDGTPDTDIPPLERTGILKNFGVDAVALCPRDGYSSRSESSSDKGTRKYRGISLGMNIKRGIQDGNFFLKIHMPNQISHVLPVNVDMTLQDLLPLIAKKRSSDDESLLPHVYKFCYVGESEAIEMNTLLKDVQSDELELARRVPKEAEMEHLLPKSEFAVTFNHARAHEYSEYQVIKTNHRGIRQKRILGVDGKKIYNRNPDGLNILGRKISMDVRRAHRLIADVVNITVMADKRQFRINFRDPKTGQIEPRHYEADTKMECAQIVAKIQFLLDERS